MPKKLIIMVNFCIFSIKPDIYINSLPLGAEKTVSLRYVPFSLFI